MEVLLLSDLPGIGKKNDLIVVGNGYALNYLLPGRKAIVVTPNVRKRYAEQIKRRALDREQERLTQATTLQSIKGKSLRFTTKASKAGKLYAAITVSMVLDALKKQFSLKLNEEQVKLAEPIKNVGPHTVMLHIGQEKVSMAIEVKNSEEAAQADKKKARSV